MQQRLHQLERRLQFDPAPFVLAQLADEYCRVGRFDDAIRCCHRLLDPHPGYFTARVVLGRALAALGRCQDAAGEFEQVLLAAPDHLAAIRELAEVYERLNRRADALDCYRRALDLSRDDPDLQVAIARVTSPGGDLAPESGPSVPASDPVDLDAVLARIGHPDRPVPPLVETLLSHPERLLPAASTGGALSPAATVALQTLDRWLAALERQRAAS